MKQAWLLALAAVLLVPGTADARKRCRPAVPEASETSAEADARWPHDVDYGWTHAEDSSWVHGRSSDDPVDHGWVHDVDYGWWAALPDAALNDIEDDAAEEELLEDCTVDKERNECAVLGNQLATYRFRLGLALQREDDLWAKSLDETLDRFEARGALMQCPWVEPSLRQKIEQTVEAVAEAVGVAAQVAAMLYRLGLL